MGKSRGCLLLLVCGEKRCTELAIGWGRTGLRLMGVSVACYLSRGVNLPQRGQLLTECSCSPKSPAPPLLLA